MSTALTAERDSGCTNRMTVGREFCIVTCRRALTHGTTHEGVVRAGCIGQCRIPSARAEPAAAVTAAVASCPGTATAIPAVATKVNAAVCRARLGLRQHIRCVWQRVGRDGGLPGSRYVGGRAGAVQRIRRATVHAGGASCVGRQQLRKRGRTGVGVGRVPS